MRTNKDSERQKRLINECVLTVAWNIAGPYITHTNNLSCRYYDKCAVRDSASDFTYTIAFTRNNPGKGRGTGPSQRH